MALPYTLAPPLPVLMPIPSFRSVTPTYPTRQLDQNDHPVVASLTSRPRSDTTCTTSSSSSFPFLQTPPTPSILSRLDQYGTSPFSSDVVPLDKGKGGPRKDSYGFGTVLEWGPSGQANASGANEHQSGTRDREPVERRVESPQIMSEDDELDQHVQLEPTSLAIQATFSDSLNGSPTPHEGILVADSNSDAPGPSTRFPTASGVPPVRTSLNLLPPPFPVEGSATQTAKPDYRRSRSSFKVAVQRKLERSRSSFKGIRSSSSGQEEHDTPVFMDPEHREIITEKPQKSRLKSLLLLPRRSGSTSSIRSLDSSTSSPTLSNLLPSTSDLLTSFESGSFGGGTAASTGATVSRSHDQSNQAGSNGRTEIPSVAANPNRTAAMNEDECTTPLTFRPRHKGEDGVRGPQWSTALRSTLPPPVSTGSPGTSPAAHAPVPFSSNQTGIDRSRTVPIPLSDKSVVGILEFQCPKPKVDLFSTMLPRELQVRILKNLLAMSATRSGDGRWDNETGGYKELIRLSRVSRMWQSLCLDGQLWSYVELAPLAGFLQYSTMRRIFDHAQTFVTSLSLRGMDNLIGSDLISGLGGISDADSFPFALGPTLLSFPSLRHLDLRGCKLLSFDSIAAIVSGAPELRTVNLKGVRGVSATVIRALARTAQHLESLDVSRCWDVSLCDLVVFIRMLNSDQAARLKVLRLGGIKGYGHTAAEFLPAVADRLINLETLDLLGCTHLFDSDFEHYVQVLNAHGRTSPLRHLIISGCSALTSATFGILASKIPDMRKLEMASLPDVFRDSTIDSKGLVRLLRSVPRLERLDLEGTGLFGGVTDLLLDAMTPGKHERGEVVGKELVELRIGHARDATPEAMIRLVRGCSKLTTFEADNTNATNAVMREFIRRRPFDSASLNLIDCRSVTPQGYSTFAPTTRPRSGWTGFQAVPFGYIGYSPFTGGSWGQGEMGGKAVLKTFWSWRRVAVPKQWRETIVDKEKAVVVDEEVGAGKKRSSSRAGMAPRRGSWWKEEGDEAGRGGCTLM